MTEKLQCNEDGCIELSYCKGLCKSHYFKQYNSDPVRAEKRKARMRARYAANREEILEDSRQKYAANPDPYKARVKRYREADPQRKKDMDRNYREKNIEKIKEYDASPERRGKHAEYMHDKYKELKMEVLNAYGNGSCSQCGDKSNRLEIDHINNDGADHRRLLIGRSRGGSFQFYQALKDLNWPTDPPLQTLCEWCHSSKRLPTDPRHITLRTEALLEYGNGTCAMCSIKPDNILILQIDHINGDGKSHRVSLGDTRGGYIFLYALKRLKWPKDPPLQTLCPPCHGNKTELERFLGLSRV